MSRRHDRQDDFGWEPPVILGCAVDGGPNSTVNDLTPAFFEDDMGRVVMYFTSYRGGNWDHYQSVMGDDDLFGPAVARDRNQQ